MCKGSSHIGRNGTFITVKHTYYSPLMCDRSCSDLMKSFINLKVADNLFLCAMTFWFLGP